MLHSIILIVGLVILILAIISGFIVVYEKEDKFPRWMTINWPVIFIMYAALIGMGYFLYLVYPYIVLFFHWLKGLGL